MTLTMVMIVDDSDADQFLAKKMLENFYPGVEILQAYDGQEALEMLSDLPKQPDLIFLDINMPRMNGHEFLEEYEEWEVQTPVVVMLTSSDQDSDKERSMAHKCVKLYLSKPLGVDDMSVIEELSQHDF